MAAVVGSDGGDHVCACAIEGCGDTQAWGSGCQTFPGSDILARVLSLDDDGAILAGLPDTLNGGVQTPVDRKGNGPKLITRVSLDKVKWGLDLAVLLTRWVGTRKGKSWSYSTAAHAMLTKRYHRQHLEPKLYKRSVNGAKVTISFLWADAKVKPPKDWIRAPAEITTGADARLQDHPLLYEETEIEKRAGGHSGRAGRISARESARVAAGLAAQEDEDEGDGSGDDGAGLAAEQRKQREQYIDQVQAGFKSVLDDCNGHPGRSAAKGTTANCAKRATAAVTADDKWDWEYLSTHQDMVQELTLFHSWGEIDAFCDWMDEEGLLSNLRLLTSKVRNSKTASAADGQDTGIGDTPKRKRRHSLRIEQRALTGRDAFFLTNYILRAAPSVTAAADRFGVDHTTASVYMLTIVWAWHFFLKARFGTAKYTKERVQNRTPPSYLKHFGKRIRRLVDAYPVYTQRPSSRRLRRAMYNKYYGKHALKLLIGQTPFGSADFGSDAYCARINDEEISEASGVCDDTPWGVDLCADKGFFMSAMLFKLGAGLIQPMKKPTGARYSQRALLYSRRVSRKRIHIERGVRRVTARCRWLQRRVPMNQLHLVYPITQISMHLGNFMCPVR